MITVSDRFCSDVSVGEGEEVLVAAPEDLPAGGAVARDMRAEARDSGHEVGDSGVAREGFGLAVSEELGGNRFEKNGFDYVGRRAVGVIAFKRSKEEEPPGDDRDDG